MIEQHHITMITTAAGPYGIYMAGVAYTVDATLARALVLCGAARYLDAPPTELVEPSTELVEVAIAPPASETADAPRTRRRKP